MSPDAQWLQPNLPQSNLPIKDSGLELRQVDSLALPTFLSAAASTISLQDSTLCLKKTSPTFLAITRESIDGFL